MIKIKDMKLIFKILKAVLEGGIGDDRRVFLNTLSLPGRLF